jgi:SAM-dependent methyltransferase
MRRIDGYLSSQLIYVAAELGVADALAAGPRSSAEVAAAVGADPAALHRVLRGLVLEDVVAEDDEGRFALTELGALLRTDAAGSLRGPAQARGRVYYGAAAGLLETVRVGGTAFEHVHGEPFFDHLARNPDREAAFQDSMAGRAARETAAVVAAYDFTRARRVVDVGGGDGVLLEAVLRAAPGVDGVLFDRPFVADRARERLAGAGLGARCECVGGDFFDAVPAGADHYVLSRVLHDWDDEPAGRILAACRRALPAGGRLLVVEALLPERAADAPGAITMDLHMLVLLGARERTEAEYRALLATAGLRLARAHTAGELAVREAVAA